MAPGQWGGNGGSVCDKWIHKSKLIVMCKIVGADDGGEEDKSVWPGWVEMPVRHVEAGQWLYSDCTGRTVNTQEVEEEEGPRAWRGEGEPVLLIDILVFNLQMLLRLCLLSH